jgi:ribosomal protein L32
MEFAMTTAILIWSTVSSSRCRECGTSLPSGEVCPPCDYLTFRGDEAASDARHRLMHIDVSSRYSPAQRASDLQTVQAYRRRLQLMERDARTPVNGCAQCGRLETDHAQSRHDYDMPTDRQRLARLKARRSKANRVLAGQY